MQRSSSRRAGRVPPILFLLIMAFALGCGQQIEYEIPDPKGEYVSEQFEFCFKLPEDWEIREEIQAAQVVGLSALQGRSDRFRENLLVKVEPLASPLESEQFLEQQMSEVERVDSGSENELPWASYLYQAKGEKLQGLLFCRVHQVQGAYYGVSFLFSQQADQFAESEPVFREAARTFKFGMEACAELQAKAAYPDDLPTPEVTRSP